MEKLFENKIFDDLFDIRRDEFENIYTKCYGNPKEVVSFEQAEEKLEQIIKEVVKNEKSQQQIFDALTNYTECSIDEKWFWNKQYYKFGFIDGLYCKKEIAEEKFLRRKIHFGKRFFKLFTFFSKTNKNGKS